MPEFIYLASQSPASPVVDQIGVRHRLPLPNAPGDVAEDAEASGSRAARRPPADLRERVTGQARRRRATPGAPGAADGAHPVRSDTTVALNDRIFGKPLDADDARRMLAQLVRATVHRVLTAAWRCRRGAALCGAGVGIACPLSR